MESTENWISIQESMPTETGWYKVRLISGAEFEVPLSITLAGKLVWVIPNELSITHWLKK